jgi:hypothetical protein
MLKYIKIKFLKIKSAFYTSEQTSGLWRCPRPSVTGTVGYCDESFIYSFYKI